MFRQALTASLAWTPIESPWTLPGGLPGEDQRSGRPASRWTTWFAASATASPTLPGASCFAGEELFRRQRDRLADVARVDPLGQRRGHGISGRGRARPEDRLA